MSGFTSYLTSNWSYILSLLWEHIELTAIAVAISVLVGVPLGILISYRRNLQSPVLQSANIMQAIPSMALLGFAIPFFGIGRLPAIIVVILYSLLPIIKNTYTGISQISPQMREAAIGIGLSRWQVLRKVELPQALPVIMAGVRISSVTAVGLMTMAAFIGAGGLGDLVFAGIRTVDNNMILAGAIPACILALAVDYILGLVEQLVTPIATQLSPTTDRKAVIGRHRRSKILIASLAILLVLGGGYAGIRQAFAPKADVVVGTKDFTENILMGHMMAEIIEDHTGLNVERRINLGGTNVAFEALKSKEIDLYLDYTGTVYVSLLKNEPISDMQRVYEEGKAGLAPLSITMLPQYAFNNTYALAVRPDFAAAHNLETISDLRAVAPNMNVGTTFEFKNRPDGLDGMTQMYGLQFANALGIDSSSRYIAINNDEVQAIDAFMTDGLLKKFNLKVLEDDRHYFPPYYATPLLRTEVAEEHPEVVDALNELAPLLTDEVMRELNYKVDEERQDPEKVAHEFLASQNLLKK
ncbi:MAG: ABC transporter permease subunit [Negativicoccus succinicivorans]|nr:glycine betaine ABC transporter substrate-binding protein [Negativicoccus succinicivorans]MBS5887318.1 ABC transporter permease subunit [Negativicoccus succinicivorans]